MEFWCLQPDWRNPFPRIKMLTASIIRSMSPDVEGTKHAWNVCKFLQEYTAHFHIRRRWRIWNLTFPWIITQLMYWPNLSSLCFCYHLWVPFREFSFPLFPECVVRKTLPPAISLMEQDCGRNRYARYDQTVPTFGTSLRNWMMFSVWICKTTIQCTVLERFWVRRFISYSHRGY
jgi:hypothetical protein